MKAVSVTMEQKIDEIFSEIKLKVLHTIAEENLYHRDIDKEISLISRCEVRGKFMDMETHCKKAITLIIKQLLKQTL